MPVKSGGVYDILEGGTCCIWMVSFGSLAVGKSKGVALGGLRPDNFLLGCSISVSAVQGFATTIWQKDGLSFGRDWGVVSAVSGST